MELQIWYNNANNDSYPGSIVRECAACVCECVKERATRQPSNIANIRLTRRPDNEFWNDVKWLKESANRHQPIKAVWNNGTFGEIAKSIFIPIINQMIIRESARWIIQWPVLLFRRAIIYSMVMMWHQRTFPFNSQHTFLCVRLSFKLYR